MRLRCIKLSHTTWLTVFGFLTHLIVLWGILDANFHSPIIHGLPTTTPLANPPAQRLVLFIADGLRFSTFNENPPPYLKSLINDGTAWGVSHARVPTESRPGNVAVVAGVYEDPSALFKGWKENPVDFDSVLNQSQSSWAWGSPDIVPIFAKGSRGNVHSSSYPNTWQDFDGFLNSSLRLDSWVFEEYDKWLSTAGENWKSQHKLIFYLHLLGCDTIGHSRKPDSQEYLESIRYVDEKIKQMVRKTESFFEPGSTTYIFTSDHGMTNWGAHGSGSTEETETPFVIWGAGANKISDRQDIEQVDFAPLISSYLGIPIPVNNEGILRRQLMISGNDEYGTNALLNNIKQLTLQVKANRLLSSGSGSSKTLRREEQLELKISEISKLIEKKEISEALSVANSTIHLAIESLNYFRQYQRNRMILYLTIIWVSWIVYLSLKAAGKVRRAAKDYLTYMLNIGFVAAVLFVILEHIISGCLDLRSPTYGCIAVAYLYFALQAAVNNYIKLDGTKFNWPTVIGIAFLIIIMSLGLFFRWILSIGMVVTAIIKSTTTQDVNSHTSQPWTALILAIFPILPVVEPHPRTWIVVCSLALILLAATVLNKTKDIFHKARDSVWAILAGTICLGLVDGRQFLSWAILVGTPVLIWISPIDPNKRIRSIIFSLHCLLCLLSASYEPFFFIILSAHLLSWHVPPTSEMPKSKSRQDEALSLKDMVDAAFLMLYTLLCFFGTGNMASISSFDPTWTRHFITLFSPFTMTALILMKLSIPLLVLGCVSQVFSSPKVYLAVLLLGDCLALPLMYKVNSQGSWLDIGTAIARFSIAVTLPCLLLLLNYLAYPFMKLNFNILPSTMQEKKHII